MDKPPHWITERPFALDHNGPSDRPFDPIDEAWLQRSMFERFEAIANRYPDRIAVDDGQVQMTYRELQQRSLALASELQGQGASSQPIAAIIPPTVLYPIALLAGLAVGRPLAPVDITHPLGRRAAILEEAQPTLVLVPAGAVLEPGLLGEGVVRRELDLAPLTGQPLPQALSAPSEALVGIAFTSGSTGRAKGLAYRQADIFRVVAEHVNSLHINEEDVILSLASLGAGGNLDVLSALLTGAKVRMLDIKSAGMGETLRVLGDDKVTLLSMIPLVFRTLFAQADAKQAFASMRSITTGGDRLLGSDLRLFRSVLPAGCHIRTTQGSTETGVVFNWFVPAEADYPDGATVPSGYLGQGKAVAIAVEDEQGRDDGVVEGDFLVRGAHLAAGAWQGGRLTPGPFVVDPTDPKQKIFDTGDVVRWRPDGLFEFVGRRDRQIKILGLRADPAEVEAILRKAPDLSDVVVIPRRTNEQAVFIAYVVPLDLRHPPQARLLRQAVQAEAPPHMVPAEVRYLPVIPRLPNFKPDYVALAALDEQNRPQEPVEAPSQPLAVPSEVSLAVEAAWSAVVGRASFLEGRAFDESGGDSLKGLQIILHLEEKLKIKLNFDLFEPGITPGGLTNKVAAALAPEVDADDDRPLVFLCLPLGGDWQRLADFRRALSSSIKFKVLDYPGLESPLGKGATLRAMLDHAEAELQAAAPEGPLRICGHSAGGCIAFELAKRLSAQGRDVAFLGLLDAPSEIPKAAREKYRHNNFAHEFEQLRARAKAAGLKGVVQDRLVALLLSLRAYDVLRGLVLRRQRGQGHRGAYTAHAVMLHARARALLGWSASTYGNPVTYFAANARLDGAKDLGWSKWLPDMRLVEVDGDHLTMLESQNLPALAAKFIGALTRSEAAAQSQMSTSLAT